MITRGLVLLVRLYQLLLSPLMLSLGAQCRFEPTCSAYSIAAIQKHGPVLGLWKTAGRISRCHPLSKGGYDPP